jgi:uncharacterized protein (TIGR01777 family)
MPMTGNREMKIAMSGASGFVGTELRRVFQERGWSCVPLGRGDFKSGTEVLAKRMDGVNVVINLAGAPVTGRWTKEYKKILYDSRINVTRKIVSAFSNMDTKPDLFISASAVGYYDSKGVHTEEKHVQASDFLGRLADDWEREALRAEELKIRTVVYRFGIVLGRDGGALQKMLLPFKLGMGGMIGNGSQGFSWIHITDLTRACIRAIEDQTFKGIYNLTSPNHSTNKEFSIALGKALNRPVVLHIPAFLLRMQLGEGAGVLTGGQTVIPGRLMESGFTFDFPELEAAVRDCVESPQSRRHG